MNNPWLRLTFVTLLPVLFSILFYRLEKRTAFSKCNYWLKQVLIGIVFGGLAVFGTEWGIPMAGAQVNCRDAAVLTAGLMFGAPAGIIAGVIGGVERWIAVAWGIGTFTRVACSVSTIIAGVYSALLRKLMFENKRPGWFISFAIGIVMEVFHLTMVFLTNMNETDQAMAVVKACTIPMLTANGISVLLSSLSLSLMNRYEMGASEKEKLPKQARISQTIQRWLLATVVLAFLATSFFVYRLQSEMATAQETTLLELALDETEQDIRDASDANLLNVAKKMLPMISRSDLTSLAYQYGITEINVVNSDGIITDSTERKFLGFDFHSGEQSQEFLCLLDGAEEYVQDYGPIAFDASISRKYAGLKYKDGFIQIGYDAGQFQRDIAQQVVGITKNRHVGENGYVLIVDSRNRILSAPGKILPGDLAFGQMQADEIGFNREAVPGENITFGEELFSVRSRVRCRFAEGYTIVAVLDESEVLKTRNVALYVNTFMEILVFAMMFGLIYMLIKRVVVNQLNQVNCSLARITGGNLDETVNVRSNAEFSSLSDDINMTVDTLKKYINEASARIDKELEFAKNIQSSALPNVFPAFPKRDDFDIYATMTPAKEVGGDFYDFYMTGTDSLHFLIADVSGKGIPAAMFMMRAKTELKSLTENELPVNDVFTGGNRALCEGNDAGMFVTSWQGGIDLKTGQIRYANAGHNPPLVYHQGGSFEYLRSRPGFVLAGMDGVKYREQELTLQRGDVIFLYTDGVTEATDANNQLYGEDRLLAAINRVKDADMRTLCEAVKKDVDAFVGDAPQFDDITMLALRYVGREPEENSVWFDKANLKNIAMATEFVEKELEKLNCPMKSVTKIDIAIDEIFSNIVNYGYPDGPGPVSVSVEAADDPKGVWIRFVDEGIAYDPLKKEDPDVTLSAQDRQIGGLGIYMVKKTMDDIRYTREDGKNILEIRKNF